MGNYDFELDMNSKNSLSIIAKDIRGNSKVLEFGSANGRLTKYLYECKKCIVDIVEIDQNAGAEAMQYARAGLLGEKGDIESFEWLELLPEEEYDYVIFADVLEHLRNPEKVLQAVKCKLNSEGVVWVSIPNISHNSIIIDLFNDKFDYNTTGLLDKTHLKFFTGMSFLKMANAAGLCFSKAYSISNRVGENELSAIYSDIPKELFKLLITRPVGNIYQYVYQLVPNERFVTGECGSLMNLDRTSYYQLCCYYREKEETEYDYRKSYTVHVYPSQNVIRVPVELKNTQGFIKIELLNACCIVSSLVIETFGGCSWKVPDKVSSNEFCKKEDVYYFTDQHPVLEFPVGNCEELKITVHFMDFDCDYSLVNNLLTVVKDSQKYKGKMKEAQDKADELEQNLKAAELRAVEAERKNAEIREQIQDTEQKNTEIWKQVQEAEQRAQELQKILESYHKQKENNIISKLKKSFKRI